MPAGHRSVDTDSLPGTCSAGRGQPTFTSWRPRGRARWGLAGHLPVSACRSDPKCWATQSAAHLTSATWGSTPASTGSRYFPNYRGIAASKLLEVGSCWSALHRRSGNCACGGRPMFRTIVCALVLAAIAGCAESPGPRSAAPRYCSVLSHEPCLDQERTGNCQPCPG